MDVYNQAYGCPHQKQGFPVALTMEQNLFGLRAWLAKFELLLMLLSLPRLTDQQQKLAIDTSDVKGQKHHMHLSLAIGCALAAHPTTSRWCIGRQLSCHGNPQLATSCLSHTSWSQEKTAEHTIINGHASCFRRGPTRQNLLFCWVFQE